jgi:glycosyltransferase involved in cell wall biosynthesis
MRILHAIHDFLPRHRAGSEIYAFNLAQELARRHDVFVVAAEYDPSTAHGTLRWRGFDGLTVVELVNNWEFEDFADSYRSQRMNVQLRHVLDATCPDVLHVHNLLNLSFDLPRLARERGIAVVATLHDYTLLCASGGQRVHASESHVCTEIDAERCSRCFAESPFAAQMGVARVPRGGAGRVAARPAAWLRRHAPPVAAMLTSQAASSIAIAPGDLRQRLAYARGVFDNVDLFVAPSQAIAAEFERHGVPPGRIDVSDYGFPEVTPLPRGAVVPPVRIGFVGTLVWHKGAHLLLEAARALRGGCEIHVHGDAATFPPYTDRLRRAAAGLPVTFHGGFDQARVDRVFAGLDILVVPSLWPENSPLVIHEAFMHGVPVVGASVGGIPELVTDGVSGLLYDPFSAPALAARLQSLIDRPGEVERLRGGLPPVKRISDDAGEWEARYGRLVARQAGQVPS